MIAVTGATGQLGRLVIAALKNQASQGEVIALARKPATAQGPGVSVRAADYSQPATLDAALRGIDTLLLVSSSEIGQRTAQHRNVIEAARRAGVGRLVYTSLLHADSSPISLAAEHVETEAALKASGIAYTILRNGWYTENYTGSVAGALAGGAFIGSAGHGRISAATRADFADAAAAVLTGSGHEGRTYELAGDTSFSLAELAAEISHQTGRALPYVNLPEAEYAAKLAGFGLPELLAKGLAAWDVDASRGALFDEGRELSRLIGRPTTSLAEAVAAALKT
jgi:NAD(P)H dehydrogenase (quinone)